MFKEFARNGTSQDVRSECTGMAFSSFRNAIGTPGETQGVLKGNLTPKIRSLLSVDQVLSIDWQCRPAIWPAWLRQTHPRVGRSLGKGGELLVLFHDGRRGWSLAHPPSVHRLHCHYGHTILIFALIPVIPGLWRNRSGLALQKRLGP